MCEALHTVFSIPMTRENHNQRSKCRFDYVCLSRKLFPLGIDTEGGEASTILSLDLNIQVRSFVLQTENLKNLCDILDVRKTIREAMDIADSFPYTDEICEKRYMCRDTYCHLVRSLPDLDIEGWKASRSLDCQFKQKVHAFVDQVEDFVITFGNTQSGEAETCSAHHSPKTSDYEQSESDTTDSLHTKRTAIPGGRLVQNKDDDSRNEDTSQAVLSDAGRD